MADWFMSDPHFGHAKILEFEKDYRPYADVDEMNEAIVHNVNELVTYEDTLYILGDIAFRSQYQYLKRLHGRRIVVILGNHDYPNKIPAIMDDIRVKVAGCLEYKGCILTHIPVHDSQKGRFIANIHGHLHDAEIDDPFYINVGMECHDMKPVLWDDLEVRFHRQELDCNEYYKKVRKPL